MKALRWHGRGDIRLDDVPVPVPGPAELLVKVTWCGICGSDLKEWQAGPVVIADGPHPATHAEPPITMGHEFVGVVADVGRPSPDGRPGTASRWRPSCAAVPAGSAGAATTTSVTWRPT